MCVPPALISSALTTAWSWALLLNPVPEPFTSSSSIQRFGLPSVIMTTRSGLPPVNPPKVLWALMRPSSQLV